MTEAEKMEVKIIVEKITKKSINDGIMFAAEMIRIAAVKHPEWTFNQLADCIEATVTKDCHE